MPYSNGRALELLRIGTGNPRAVFREGQEEAIRHVVEGKGRLLVVQKTGWGKSFVYFIATKMLREEGFGPTLLVSPLLSLMRNQISAAGRMGVVAETINSDNEERWIEVEDRLKRDEIDILLISPERFGNERFRTEVLARISGKIGFLVVDEAHCISDWGHDFRPHYRLIERIARNLPPNLRLLGTTATANNRVMRDLTSVLGPNLAVLRGDLNRSSLTLQTLKLPDQADRLAWLAGTLPILKGSGIIYTLTVRDANQVADWLKCKGFKVEAYTGETGDRRIELENALLENRIKALVATTALGMGFDKPDLAFVIHYQVPGSPIAYYQQVGRAGRALDSAYGILLSGEEEDEINDWFIKTAFPTRKEVSEILEALESEQDGLSIYGLMGRLNMRKARIEKVMNILSLESPSPIAKQGSKWQLTAAKLGEGFWQRADRVTALRREEQRQMKEYVELPFGEHMPYLISALDGDPRKVGAPPLPPLPVSVDNRLVKEAVAFLRRIQQFFPPREKWPVGGMPVYRTKGLIPENLRAENGVALCLWGDSGWGTLVREGKYRDGRFTDELVEACAEMFRKWNPRPSPTWITCIPSLRRPDLVPDFAGRLASALGLPFLHVLEKMCDRPEQKTMANSVQQARNIDGSLRITGPVPKGPVLLVDDMVNSRWTFTVSAWLLRKNGSGEVWPLALSNAGYGQ